MIDPLPRPNPSARILLACDEEIAADAGMLLAAHGHAVIISGLSGTEALAALEQHSPEVILLGAMVPDGTAFDLCRLLRSSLPATNVPVIFLSGEACKGAVMDALKAGADDFLTLPFHGPELVSRVELHSNRRKLHLRLEKVIKEKNRLLEIVAHDLKNPLSGIQFAATMLGENPNLPAETRGTLVTSISESVDRAFGIISDLLETRSLEEEKLSVAKSPLSLRDHAVRAIANFEQHCRRKDIRIDFGQENHEIDVMGESRLLMCCMENLLSNAIKFSPRGSTVSIDLHRGDEGGVFRIRDQGPGILAEEVDLLFGKFTRLSARPTAGEASTGMGLHIVHELVSAMGGTVSYDKSGEPGAVFVINLPLAG